jgi:hypothetical protein
MVDDGYVLLRVAVSDLAGGLVKINETSRTIRPSDERLEKTRI